MFNSLLVAAINVSKASIYLIPKDFAVWYVMKSK